MMMMWASMAGLLLSVGPPFLLFLFCDSAFFFPRSMHRWCTIHSLFLCRGVSLARWVASAALLLVFCRLFGSSLLDLGWVAKIRSCSSWEDVIVLLDGGRGAYHQSFASLSWVTFPPDSSASAFMERGKSFGERRGPGLSFRVSSFRFNPQMKQSKVI